MHRVAHAARRACRRRRAASSRCRSAESAETRKATAPATSCAVPTRPSGGRSQLGRVSGLRPARRSCVAIPGAVSPGQTALTRIPSGPASTASIWTSMFSARFETEYAPIAASAQTPASEDDRHDRAAAARAQSAEGRRARSGTGRRGSSREPRPRPRRTSRQSGASCSTPALSTSGVEAARGRSTASADRTLARRPARVASACRNDAPGTRRPRRSPRSCRSRPVKATRPPSARSRSTIAAPIPEVPPVTSARRSGEAAHGARSSTGAV